MGRFTNMIANTKLLKVILGGIVVVSISQMVIGQTRSKLPDGYMITSSGDCQFADSNGYTVNDVQACSDICAANKANCQGFSFNESLIGSSNQNNCFIRSGGCESTGRDISSGFQFYNKR